MESSKFVEQQDVLNEHRPMIVFGEDWGGHPSSTQHLIKVLRESRDVIWINSIGLRAPRISVRDIARIFAKLAAFGFSFFSKRESPHRAERQEPITSSNEQPPVNDRFMFKVISPLIVPCPRSSLMVKINRWLLKLQVKNSLKSMAQNAPIVWTSLPTAVDYLSLFNGHADVYYCGDDFGALAGVDHDYVAPKEKKLLGRANMVFVASEALNNKFVQPSVTPKIGSIQEPIGARTVTIPHGVDTQLFNPTKRPKPDDLPVGRPIVGFYGSISSWLDQKLIVEAAQILKGWNFVLVGNIECDVSALKALDNIYFLPAKAHQELPNYLAHWQVALLPFKDNEQIRKCNPLKLREYLASGVPIVTTEFNAMKEYQDLVEVVNSSQSIADAIVSACKFGNDSEAKEQRMNSVSTASWQERAKLVDSYLMKC